MGSRQCDVQDLLSDAYTALHSATGMLLVMQMTGNSCYFAVRLRILLPVGNCTLPKLVADVAYHNDSQYGNFSTPNIWCLASQQLKLNCTLAVISIFIAFAE